MKKERNFSASNKLAKANRDHNQEVMKLRLDATLTKDIHKLTAMLEELKQPIQGTDDSPVDLDSLINAVESIGKGLIKKLDSVGTHYEKIFTEHERSVAKYELDVYEKKHKLKS